MKTDMLFNQLCMVIRYGLYRRKSMDNNSNGVVMYGY